MNATSLASGLGWTLIHSIWQGLLIFIVLKVAIRLTDRSDVRYGLGVAALLMMLVASGITFLILNDASSTSGQAFNFVINSNAATAASSQSILTTALHFIDNNIIWLIRFWVLGFAIGLIRILAGLWYINRLRSTSYPVQDEWMRMVNDLSKSLNIKRMVAMAEAGITSPMVVGFMKPVILFPFGLLAGLTPEQVETILVHELSHVRRQDYIINLFQAIVETIFFFNPFVIMISSLIREERENCCDDMVIAKGVSPISYVRTLAQLEASRSSSTLALGISGNKNQLLNRIKRIMENSAKNDWGKGRLVPVALVFLGLICASWLSIGSEADPKETNNISYVTQISKHEIASDTSREDGLKVIKSNKHRLYDVPMVPMPPDVDIDMDIEMDAALDAIQALEAMPPMEALAPMDFVIPDFPEVPMEAWEAFEYQNFDSLPGSFRWRERGNREDWQEFEQEFTEKFREEFKEFYEKNREQFEKMMQEVEKERREAAEVVDLDRMRAKMMLERDMAKIAGTPRVVVTPRVAVAPFKLMDDQFKVMNDQLLHQSDMLAEMSRNFDDYKDELTKLLTEDGYLNKGERLENLNINDDGGDLTINGHKIKEKDQVKYRALHDKYFQEQRYKREGPRRQE